MTAKPTTTGPNDDPSTDTGSTGNPPKAAGPTANPAKTSGPTANPPSATEPTASAPSTDESATAGPSTTTEPTASPAISGPTGNSPTATDSFAIPPSTATLFRAHATARLRGNIAESSRLAAQIEPGQRVTHLLFLVSLLAQAVVEEYGSQPDPGDLAAVTKRLHHRHFETNPGFNALRAEATIRAVCGESVLLTEIPHAELPAYLWAVIGELVEPDLTDAELSELFDCAEESGLECLTEAFEETIRNHPRRTTRQEPTPPDPQSAAKPETETEAEADNTSATDTAEAADCTDTESAAAAAIVARAADHADNAPSDESDPAAPSKEEPA